MKYKLTNTSKIVNSIEVWQIECTSPSEVVPFGALGGFVESYENLSLNGRCWIYPDSVCYANARIKDNALVAGSCVIKDDAILKEFVVASDNAVIEGHAVIDGNAKLSGDCIVGGDAIITGDAIVTDSAHITTSTIGGSVRVFGEAIITQEPIIAEDFIDDRTLVFADNCLSVGCIQFTIPSWEKLTLAIAVKLEIDEWWDWWVINKEAILGYQED